MKERYNLTREQIQAIAARAAELAVEQALCGTIPALYSTTTAPTQEPPQDGRELTQIERAAVAAIFE